MKNGISTLSIIPLRKEPSHRSEIVSQILFGETYEVLNKSESWLQVRCHYDDYEGWMDLIQHHELSEKDFTAISQGEYGVALELVSNAASSQHSIPVVAGSTLPFFDGLNFKIGKEKFIYNGQAVAHE